MPCYLYKFPREERAAAMVKIACTKPQSSRLIQALEQLESPEWGDQLGDRGGHDLFISGLGGSAQLR